MFILLLHSALAYTLESIPSSNTPPELFYSSGIVYNSLTNSLILFGGHNVVEDIYTNSLYTFSLSTLTWGQLYPESLYIPPAINDPILYLRSDNVFLSVFGIINTGYISDFLLYNITSRSWSLAEFPKTLQGRAHSAYTTLEWEGQEYLAIYGGYLANGITNSLNLINVWTFEIIELEMNGEVPGGGFGNSLKFFQGLFYLYGYSQKIPLNDPRQTSVYLYNLTERIWKFLVTTGVTPPILVSQSAHVVNSKMFMINGFNPLTYAPNFQVYCLDLITNIWSIIQGISTAQFARTLYYSAQLNDTIWIAGGRNEEQTYNTILQLKFDYPSVEITTLSPNWIFPSARKNHGMYLINYKLVLFAGLGKTGFLSDVWTFDLENTVWAQLSPNGEIPSPRSTFAGCNAMGSGFMIFGGTGASIYNDLYYYDLNSNYWKNLIPSSLPSGRFASCMSIGKYLYLHGGITSTGVTDEVWVYDFYSNSFQLAINAGRIRLFVARHMCRLEESEESETFYVIGGESFYQLPNKVIYAVTIYQISGIFYYKILEVYKDFTGMIGRSDSSLVYTLNYTMQFFGTIYGFYATSFIAVINNFSQTAFPIFLPSTFYAQSVIHYKKDLYIYGGGFSMDTTTQIKSFSNNFYKLSLTESDYVSMDCSLGTIGAFCELCPKGTYATNLTYCEPCIAGKMSNNIGATTSQICLPCGYGSFSNIVGASYCKNCETNMICMIGTKTPVNQSSFGNEKSIQPRAFQAEKNPFSQNILYLLMGGFVAPIALGFLLFSQVREKVKKFDMYASQHQQKENEAIIMKKTSIGGLFSVFFLMLSLLLVISAVVAFSKDNVYETKGLVPIITITDEVFSESFSISAVFYNYGGLCAGDLNYNSRIFIEDSTLNYSSKAITCERTVNDCIVSIDYQKLSISFNPSVTFKLEEQGSFASYISLNTTSLSSIPGETSSILLFSYPNSPQEVFRGSIPTVFSLEATPSIFYSESSSWPSVNTGYHIGLLDSPVQGSTDTQEMLNLYSGLTLKVILYRNNSALVTQRQLTYTWTLLVSALLGTVFGLMQLIGIAMEQTENFCKKLQVKEEVKTTFSNIKNQQTHIFTNFPIEEANDTQCLNNRTVSETVETYFKFT